MEGVDLATLAAVSPEMKTTETEISEGLSTHRLSTELSTQLALRLTRGAAGCSVAVGNPASVVGAEQLALWPTEILKSTVCLSF